eukprot:TRINITY_DN7122_c0_g1_i1.p1 TRINITY_DN7122_c0_g1~~TRINITY_DN7122_c0_g1_i1.p1  ORF type:complete len:747 (+),score=104.64 TRINITY_DN7122_c0_g1_i1:190-2241(+)
MDVSSCSENEDEQHISRRRKRRMQLAADPVRRAKSDFIPKIAASLRNSDSHLLEHLFQRYGDLMVSRVGSVDTLMKALRCGHSAENIAIIHVLLRYDTPVTAKHTLWLMTQLLNHSHISLWLGVIRLLLAYNLPLDVVSPSTGKSLAILAVQFQHFELMETLLDNGFAPSVADQDGNTLLHHAVRLYVRDFANNREFWALLIDHGLNVDARNGLGLTALHLAATCDTDVMSRMMEAFPMMDTMALTPDGESVVSLSKLCSNGCVFPRSFVPAVAPAPPAAAFDYLSRSESCAVVAAPSTVASVSQLGMKLVPLRQFIATPSDEYQFCPKESLLLGNGSFILGRHAIVALNDDTQTVYALPCGRSCSYVREPCVRVDSTRSLVCQRTLSGVRLLRVTDRLALLSECALLDESQLMAVSSRCAILRAESSVQMLDWLDGSIHLLLNERLGSESVLSICEEHVAVLTAGSSLRVVSLLDPTEIWHCPKSIALPSAQQMLLLPRYVVLGSYKNGISVLDRQSSQLRCLFLSFPVLQLVPSLNKDVVIVITEGSILLVHLPTMNVAAKFVHQGVSFTSAVSTGNVLACSSTLMKLWAPRTAPELSSHFLFRFPAVMFPWTASAHRDFPVEFRGMVQMMLLGSSWDGATGRPRHEECLLSMLPLDVLCGVFAWLAVAMYQSWDTMSIGI